MEQYQLDAIKERFEGQQSKREARAHRAGRVTRIIDKIFPPLTVKSSGDAPISVYEGSVAGIQRITTIMNNQQEGRPLDTDLQSE